MDVEPPPLAQDKARDKVQDKAQDKAKPRRRGAAAAKPKKRPRTTTALSWRPLVAILPDLSRLLSGARKDSSDGAKSLWPPPNYALAIMGVFVVGFVCGTLHHQQGPCGGLLPPTMADRHPKPLIRLNAAASLARPR